MGTLYRIQLSDEKTNIKLGDPWPDTGPGPDGVPISEKYVVGAMFYEPEQEADDEGGEAFPAYFELWAQPKGVSQPNADFPTFRMRLWLDSAMKMTVELWNWADMEQAIALRMGYDPDAPIEQEPVPELPPQQVAPAGNPFRGKPTPAVAPG